MLYVLDFRVSASFRTGVDSTTMPSSFKMKCLKHPLLQKNCRRVEVLFTKIMKYRCTSSPTVVVNRTATDFHRCEVYPSYSLYAAAIVKPIKALQRLLRTLMVDCTARAPTILNGRPRSLFCIKAR